jgi:hypothetical protein
VALVLGVGWFRLRILYRATHLRELESRVTSVRPALRAIITFSRCRHSGEIEGMETRKSWTFGTGCGSARRRRARGGRQLLDGHVS